MHFSKRLSDQYTTGYSAECCCCSHLLRTLTVVVVVVVVVAWVKVRMTATAGYEKRKDMLWLGMLPLSSHSKWKLWLIFAPSKDIPLLRL